MARKRSLEVCGLNIRIHPHSTELYDSLIRDAYSLKMSFRSRGDQRLMLGAISRDPRQKMGFIWGNIARFTEIDTELPWFNAQTFDEADDDDLSLINIPADLKPNYRPFWFAFFPEHHIFVFEKYSLGQALSPRMVLKFMNNLLNHEDLTRRYGYASLSIVADRERLEEIIGLAQLRHLTIVVKKPNADDFGDYDEEVEERMLAQNAKRLTISYDATPGMSLAPDEATQNIALVAMENGEVKAAGKNEEGQTVERSSLDHPRTEVVKYDPDLTTDQQAFIKAAVKFIDRFVRG